LEVVPGEHLLVADSAQAFARETVRLLADASLRQRIVAQARALVESAYDWDVIVERMLAMYSALVEERG
jgi:glycosyltransferase involved in cell wall biosynthesis